MRHRLPRLLFVALCGLAPAVLGHLLRWSAWQWGFLTMVTLSGSLLLVMTVLGGDRASAPPPPEGAEPATTPTQQPFQETYVVDATLPSATEGYDFLFSATVWWRSVTEDSELSDDAAPSLAKSSVTSRAAEVVRHQHPGRAGFTQYLLDGELGVPLPDKNGRVTAMATDVTLTLAAGDSERLRKLNDLRKDEEIWEYERQRERNMRRYLGEDVLKSPGSAVVWWLARHEDEIEKAVAMIGPLAQISAAANDEEVPELFRHLLIPPVSASRSGVTVQGSQWDTSIEGQEPFNREEEVGVADRLLLLLTALNLKPDTDGFTVFVHRVVRGLEAEGLDEAAEEIRQTLLSAPGERRAPSQECPPVTESDVDAETDAEMSTPGTSGNGAGSQGQNGRGTNEDLITPTGFRDPSHSPHQPDEPRPEKEKGEDHA